MQALEMDLDFESAKGEFEEILNTFNREIEKIYQKLEESQKETLSGLGISGSAVRPNVREKADFQNEFNQMRTPYDLRIDELKGKMLPLI